MWIRAMLIVSFSALATACAPNRSQRLHAIGDYFAQHTIAGTVSGLVDSRSVPDVVRIGPILPSVLAAMRADFQSGYTVEIQQGDAFGQAGEVTQSIILRTAQGGICLRMRYDSSLDRFHIVGYGAPQRRQGQNP